MASPGTATAQLEAQKPADVEVSGETVLDPKTVLSPDAVSAPMSIELNQLRNGSAAAPDETDGAPNWQNGNVGAQHGHLEEGWSIPYRARIENIPSACYSGTDTYPSE